MAKPFKQPKSGSFVLPSVAFSHRTAVTTTTCRTFLSLPRTTGNVTPWNRFLSSTSDTSDTTSDTADTTTTTTSTTTPSNNQRTELFALAAAGHAAQAHAIILKQHKDDNNTTTNSSSSNSNSNSAAAYTACMEAWANTNDLTSSSSFVTKAERINELLELMYTQAIRTNNKLLLPTSTHYMAVLTAWSLVPHDQKGVPQRAQRVLELMESRSTTTTSRPTIDMYNRVFNIWGQSKEHARATFATQLFNTMSTSSKNLVQPTAETFRIMIQVWCNSGQKRAALNAKAYLLTMTDLLTSSGRFDMEPTLQEYHFVFKAMVTAKEKGAAVQGFDLLTHMNFLFVHRYTQVRPDLLCYKCVLQTLANSTIHNLGPKVDAVFKFMQERHILADIDCYSAAIQTWANDARHKKCQDPFKSASRAHELLYAMNRAHHTQTDLFLTTNDYNHVLNAWSATSRPVVPLQNAHALLATMIASSDTRPNAESYAAILITYAISKNTEKLLPAMELFEQAKQRLGTSILPSVYNGFIRVCASQKDSTIMMQAFSLAIQTFRDARLANMCDADTFHSMLSACNNLIPVGEARNRALETVFEEGCKLGLLNREILNLFRDICSDDVYTKMVVAAAQDEPKLGGKRLPPSWSCRSGVPLNDTPIGHVVRPITADGDFLWTTNLMEHRMRHLKQHTGRRLLRGGRLDMNEQKLN